MDSRADYDEVVRLLSTVFGQADFSLDNSYWAPTLMEMVEDGLVSMKRTGEGFAQFRLIPELDRISPESEPKPKIAKSHLEFEEDGSW